VKDGQTTSAPGPMPRAMSASSRACVHEVVRSTRRPSSIADSRSSTVWPKGPFPATRPARARRTDSASAESNQVSQSAMGRAVTGADYGISEPPHIGP
jgi:hypothetical protein